MGGTDLLAPRKIEQGNSYTWSVQTLDMRHMSHKTLPKYVIRQVFYDNWSMVNFNLLIASGGLY